MAGTNATKSGSEIEELVKRLRHLIQMGSPIVKCIRYPKMLISALEELDSLVEMKEIKSSIVKQVRFLLVSNQGSLSEHGKGIKFQGHVLHTVIYGKAGMGKTVTACILAKIWTSLGLVKASQEGPAEAKATQVEGQIRSNMMPALTEKIREAFLVTRILELQSTVVSHQNRLKKIRDSAMKQRDSLKRIRRRTIRHHPYSRDAERTTRSVDSAMDEEHWEDLLRDIKDVQYALDDLVKEATLNPDDMEEDNDETPDEPIPFPGLSLFIRPPGLPGLPGGSGETNATARPLIPPMVTPVPVVPTVPVVAPAPIPKEEKEPNDIPITIVSRVDLVAEYVGHSAIKTENLLKKNLGKVVFIDEAYSLIHGDRDSFGMEVLTVLNRFMSEHAHEIIIILAGYREMMQESIFKAQPGLRRRCGWVFEIKDYTPAGLSAIFAKQLKEHGWSVDPDLNMEAFFSRHMSSFTGFGGDTERLAFYAKLCHATAKFNEAYENILAGSTVKFDNVITKEILEESLLSLKGNDATKEEGLPEMYKHLFN